MKKCFIVAFERGEKLKDALNEAFNRNKLKCWNNSKKKNDKTVERVKSSKDKKNNGNTSNDIAASVDNIIDTLRIENQKNRENLHTELNFPSAIFVISFNSSVFNLPIRLFQAIFLNEIFHHCIILSCFAHFLMIGHENRITYIESDNIDSKR